jgi:hypothetical protein
MFVDADVAATSAVEAARAMGDRYKLARALDLRADVRTQLGSDAGARDRDEGRALITPLDIKR